jgi:hypothetical protein
MATDFLYQDIEGTEAKAHTLIASLSGLPETIVKKLRSTDYLAVKSTAFEIMGTLIIENRSMPIEPSMILSLRISVSANPASTRLQHFDSGITRLLKIISVVRRLSGAAFLAADKKAGVIIEAKKGN